MVGPERNNDYETARCAGYIAGLNSTAVSDASAFCSAVISLRVLCR